MHKNSEEKIKSKISPEAKYTNFHEKLQYYFIKKYMTLKISVTLIQYIDVC